MRILFYVAIFGAVLSIGYAVLTFWPQLMSSADFGPNIRIPAVIGFLAGLLGGMLGSRLLSPVVSEDDSGKWKLELRKLRDDFESDRRIRLERQNNAAEQRFVGNSTSRGTSEIEQGSARHESFFKYQPQGDDETKRHENTKYSAPAKPSLARDEIMRRYREAVSGTISRSTFRLFFDEIGAWGPVDPEDGGRRISASKDDEGFLVSVMNGTEALVFPSYNFVANQDTQFSTIASVPETVASAFSLVRGAGDIVLGTPAVYLTDGEGSAVLVSRGEIRGFSG